ncbi:chloride channel protein [Chitinophaga sp. 212800010-3]|uniref:chloride channel protein n=1 Tax=unclassified Chitinophaga TaxID=2619133 RepID=UPI002DE33C69|nr:hypothetical protein [Chitinophaga sp. 212800010-3]
MIFRHNYLNGRILPVIPLLPSGTTVPSKSGLKLSLAAALVAAFGTGIGILVKYVMNTLTALIFFGNLHTGNIRMNDIESAPWLMVIPVAGALFLTWATGKGAAFFSALGLTVAAGAGAPVGAESPGTLLIAAASARISGLFRCTDEESHLLFLAGICGVVSCLFGAPLAALILVLELWVNRCNIRSIWPLAIAALVSGTTVYLINGFAPVYNMPNAPAVNIKSLTAYLLVGVFTGLWSRLTVWLYKRLQKGFENLSARSNWYILLGSLMVGVVAYIYPGTLGAGESSVNDLLQAHVTLSILFSLAVMKWLSWLFFSSAYRTGTGIIPLLITGGAVALFVGVAIQLLFPSLVIHSGTIVLTGMCAMLAGTSGALLTSMVLSVEITHDLNAVVPVIAACLVSYFISIPALKKEAVPQ